MAHWVDEAASLQLKTALIGFHCLCEGQDGKLVANTLITLLDRAGVTVKVRAYLDADWK
jgi:hypothetical protein